MSIITHSADTTLAPTLRALTTQLGNVRAALDAVIADGFRSVQIDATLAGLRPRDLNRRARRDLMALLTRNSVQLAGLDLFIPRKHFASGEHVDRAVAATIEAMTLSHDFGCVPISIALPVGEMTEDVVTSLLEAADGRGVPLAVHAEDRLDDLAAWLDKVDLPNVGAALDPAAVLSRSADPAQIAQRWSKRLKVARLSDLESAGGAVRCPVGEGELDVLQYRLAVDLATARVGPVVLDLRNLELARQAAARGKAAWDDAAFSL